MHYVQLETQKYYCLPYSYEDIMQKSNKAIGALQPNYSYSNLSNLNKYTI